MFGYVKPKRTDLLVSDEAFYRAAYCGLCRAMKSETGGASRALLTYDGVFLTLCRMVFLPDASFGGEEIFCPLHPLKKKNALKNNEALSYTARVFGVLSYYKFLDDKKDGDKKFRTAAALPLAKSARGRARLPALEDTVRRELSAISDLEDKKSPSVDEGAEHFGVLLGAVFAEGTAGTAARLLYETGYHLGKFIYAADAAEDYEKDRGSGAYNPFVLAYDGGELSDENAQNVKCGLLLEAQNLASVIELYPFGKRATLERIIKNIVYLGLPERIRFLDREDTDGSV